MRSDFVSKLPWNGELKKHTTQALAGGSSFVSSDRPQLARLAQPLGDPRRFHFLEQGLDRLGPSGSGEARRSFAKAARRERG